ncbi:MAG: hypothetical protein ACREGI_06010 [Candidatus Levyibacteriota bacterium]
MQKTRAYSSAALSSIFKVWKDENGEIIGSTGVGFTVNKGVIVTALHSQKNEIIVNGKIAVFPAVQYVIDQLSSSPVQIMVETQLPLGVGFGLSGACSLAAAYAIGKLFQLQKSALDLAFVAEKADRESNTGLGTVGTVFTGGFFIKDKPGIPIVGRKLNFSGEKIYSVIFDSIATENVLTGDSEKINSTADIAFNTFKNKENLTLGEIIDISYEFSKESGLLQNEKVKAAIESVRSHGGHASMHMVGNAVFSTTKNGLEQYGDVLELEIAGESAKIL